MIRRFLGIFGAQIVSRYTRRSSRRRGGFRSFTVPSLAVGFAPAASPLIVHLSCFTPLKQQSPLTVPGLLVDEAVLVRCLRASYRCEFEKSPIYLFIYLGGNGAKETPESHHSYIQTRCLLCRGWIKIASVLKSRTLLSPIE